MENKIKKTIPKTKNATKDISENFAREDVCEQSHKIQTEEDTKKEISEKKNARPKILSSFVILFDFDFRMEITPPVKNYVISSY